MIKPAYSPADLAAVADNPELTAADLAAAKPFAETFPQAAKALRAARGPQKAPTKVATTIRLSPDVVAFFRQGGQGWQSRINAALRDWMTAQH